MSDSAKCHGDEERECGKEGGVLARGLEKARK